MRKVQHWNNSRNDYPYRRKRKKKGYNTLYIIGFAILAFFLIGFAIAFTIRACANHKEVTNITAQLGAYNSYTRSVGYEETHPIESLYTLSDSLVLHPRCSGRCPS